MSHPADTETRQAPFVGPQRPSTAHGPRLVLIAAVAENRVIGSAGKLPWRLPADLQRFKQLTLGHPVIMGRLTWESIGARPLPQRRNIVVTRTAGYPAPGAEVAASLEAALALCAGERLAYVIGGERLYAAAMPLADGLELTEIRRSYRGDARFPEYDRSRWRETRREGHVAPDGTAFDFVSYGRANADAESS